MVTLEEMENYDFNEFVNLYRDLNDSVLRAQLVVKSKHLLKSLGYTLKINGRDEF